MELSLACIRAFIDISRNVEHFAFYNNSGNKNITLSWRLLETLKSFHDEPHNPCNYSDHGPWIGWNIYWTANPDQVGY